MQQFLHLLVVDPDRCEGLASWFGRRWLLPAISCHERARAAPLAGDWAAKRGLSVRMAGQWLGKLTPKRDGIDWLTVLRARRSQPTAQPTDLSWVALQLLTSSPALLDYQQWAVTRATQAERRSFPFDLLPEVPGPFGTMAWAEEVEAWLAALGWPSTGERTVCHRATASEIVCTFSTSRGLVHFKGLAEARSGEAHTTAALSHAVPGSFASTLALESRPDGSTWWLTDHCPGGDLASDLTSKRSAQVVVACARVQERLASKLHNPALHTSAPQTHARFGLPNVDLPGVLAWAVELFRDDKCSQDINHGAAVEHCEAALARISEAANAASIPRSWIPLDLDPTNVLLDDDSVRFIDLDRSYIGPAALAISIFLRRIARLPSGHTLDRSCRKALLQAYQNAWSRPFLVDRLWADFDLASALLEAHLGWLQAAALTERGELFDVLDFATTQLAKRLFKTVSLASGIRPHDTIV